MAVVAKSRIKIWSARACAVICCYSDDGRRAPLKGTLLPLAGRQTPAHLGSKPGVDRNAFRNFRKGEILVNLLLFSGFFGRFLFHSTL